MVIENAVQNRAKRETWLAKGVKGLLIQEWDLSIANKEPQKIFLLSWKILEKPMKVIDGRNE